MVCFGWLNLIYLRFLWFNPIELNLRVSFRFVAIVARDGHYRVPAPQTPYGRNLKKNNQPYLLLVLCEKSPTIHVATRTPLCRMRAKQRTQEWIRNLRVTSLQTICGATRKTMVFLSKTANGLLPLAPRGATPNYARKQQRNANACVCSPQQIMQWWEECLAATICASHGVRAKPRSNQTAKTKRNTKNKRTT